MSVTVNTLLGKTTCEDNNSCEETKPAVAPAAKPAKKKTTEIPFDSIDITRGNKKTTVNLAETSGCLQIIRGSQVVFFDPATRIRYTESLACAKATLDS